MNGNLTILICVCIIVQSNSTRFVKPPNFPKPCPLSLPNYEKCAENFLREASPFILSGNRHLKLPNLQPVIIPQINLEETIAGNLFKVQAKKVVANGFDSGKLLNFRLDKKNMSSTISLKLEELFIQADANLTIINPLIKYTIPQYIEVAARDIDLIFDYQLRPIKKHGNKRFELQSFKINSVIHKAQIKLKHKNPDEQILSTFIQDTFNRNSKLFLKLIESIHNDYLTVYYGAVIRRMLDILPADELIPLV